MEESNRTTVQKTSILHPRSNPDQKVYKGRDLFWFPNGDTYCGGFRATVDGNIVRQGPGRYFTSDNHSYQGNWENDTLNGEAKICFPDGSIYFGDVEDLHFHGRGVYTFPHGGKMIANFVRDMPVGQVKFEDSNGNFWFGTAQSNGVLLNPLNRFLPVSEQEKLIAFKNNTQNS